MARREPVVVDSSVWIPFLQGETSPEVDWLREVLRADRAALSGVVLAEVLQGARGDRDRQRLEDALSGTHCLHLGRADHEVAGSLSTSLRRSGRTIPLSDVLVATAAMRHRLTLLAADAHFEAIPGLSLHRR